MFLTILVETFKKLTNDYEVGGFLININIMQ